MLEQAPKQLGLVVHWTFLQIFKWKSIFDISPFSSWWENIGSHQFNFCFWFAWQSVVKILLLIDNTRRFFCKFWPDKKRRSGGQSYKNFNTSGQIYELVLKLDNMVWFRKHLVWILGHYILKYSQSNYCHRGTNSNVGTLFYKALIVI